MISLWYTNAPEEYDYSYVETVREVSPTWRLVRVSDQMRFENFQRPRYGSGLYVAVEAAPGHDNTLGVLASFGLEPLSLNEVLSALNLTTHAGNNGKKDIVDEGSFVVFQGRAGEVWGWLRESGRLA